MIFVYFVEEKKNPTMPGFLGNEIFERQSNTTGRRTCGAAVLCMVYRSFGFEADHDAIWDELHSPENNGAAPGKTPNLRTNALVKHLRENRPGFDALAVRIGSPWEFLLEFKATEQRLILNHRTRPNSPEGHFTLLCGLDPERERVYLHDPQAGPFRELKKAEILPLWQPIKGRRNEISGNIAIIVAQKPDIPKNYATTCQTCAADFSKEFIADYENFEIFCPQCDRVIGK